MCIDRDGVNVAVAVVVVRVEWVKDMTSSARDPARRESVDHDTPETVEDEDEDEEEEEEDDRWDVDTTGEDPVDRCGKVGPSGPALSISAKAGAGAGAGAGVVGRGAGAGAGANRDATRAWER
jgi:hypothetical protein